VTPFFQKIGVTPFFLTPFFRFLFLLFLIYGGVITRRLEDTLRQTPRIKIEANSFTDLLDKNQTRGILQSKVKTRKE